MKENSKYVLWMLDQVHLKTLPNQSNKTIKEVFNTLNKEQKAAVYALIGMLIEKIKKDQK